MKLPSNYHQGKSRPFFSPVEKLTTLTSKDHFVLFVLGALTILVRFYKLPIPDEVVFDEVHFGGFMKNYNEGKFFIDNHPPLTKLCYYWIAKLSGWDGKFAFSSIGDQFINVPFIQLRLFLVILGSLTIPLTYLILRANHCDIIPSMFGSSLVLFENSMITQSRYIFLDSSLICTTCLTYYFYSKFKQYRQFTFEWYKFLVYTGFSLGLTISTKMSGLLVLLWLGVVSLLQMWVLLGDLRVSDFSWFKHLVARAICLILIPFTIYCSIFAIHLDHLPYLGKAGLLSPNFKASFKDAGWLRNEPVEVSYGASVTIKHNEMESYLHSHPYKYKNTKLQQVTLYDSHTDFSNEWEIHPKNKRTNDWLYDEFRPIKDGDVVRLFHKHTKKFLTVKRDDRPPITEKDYASQVACNGSRDMLADIEYDFKIRILNKKPHSKTNLPMLKLRATESIFQLVHQSTGCHVMSHEGRLPNYGFGQNEVLCIKEATIPNSLWYIEKNSHPQMKKQTLAKVDLSNYPFYKKFIEYHKIIFRLNNGLIKHHPYESRPESWPFTIQGVGYFSSDARPKIGSEEGSTVYYIGNVAVYYFSIIAIGLVILKQALYYIDHLNPFSLVNETWESTVFYQTTLEAILGFIINYIPYFQMTRQLFLHHYLISLYFAILNLTFVVHYCKKKGWAMMVVIMGLTGFCYYQFFPLIYGSPWTQSGCNSAKWFENWDFDCSAYKN